MISVWTDTYLREMESLNEALLQNCAFLQQLVTVRRYNEHGAI